MKPTIALNRSGKIAALLAATILFSNLLFFFLFGSSSILHNEMNPSISSVEVTYWISTDRDSRDIDFIVERPRQALPAIRIPGDDFEVWLSGEGLSEASSVTVTAEAYGSQVILDVLGFNETGGRLIIETDIPLFIKPGLYDLDFSVNGVLRTTVKSLSIVNEYRDDFKFIQLTDVHIDDKNSENNLRAVIDEVNLINPAFVVFTGDTLDADPTGSSTSTQEQANIFMSIANNLEVPFYAVPGNHEYGYLTADGIEVYLGTINPLLDYSFNYGPYHFIGMNCGKYQTMTGGIPSPSNNVQSFTEEQVTWLTQDLAEHNNDHNMAIFQHAPLKTENGKELPLWNREEVENLMRQYGVKTYFAGHTHADFIMDGNDEILQGDWSLPTYPLFIQTDTAGAEDTVEACRYRVYKVNQGNIEYCTYDDNNDGIKSAFRSTPAGLLEVSYESNNDFSQSANTFTVKNFQTEDIVNAKVELRLASPASGFDYVPDTGYVSRIFDTPDGQLVDVSFNLTKNSQWAIGVEQKDITPPCIANLTSSVGQDSDGIYDVGHEVEIIIVDDNNESGLWATIDITDENDRSIVDGGVLDSLGFGRYSYIWNTSEIIPWVNYSVKGKLEDPAGNMDIGEKFNLTSINIYMVDTTPPVISRVTASSEGEEAETFSLGSEIIISVLEGKSESGLTGSIQVELLNAKNKTYNHTFILEEEYLGNYIYEWDTVQLNHGFYGIKAELQDPWGNIVQGVHADLDLKIGLIDDIPPEVFSAVPYVISNEERIEDDEFALGDVVHFEVIEKNLEGELNGNICIQHSTGELVTVFPLAPLSDVGHYGASWNTIGNMEGSYTANVTLWDDAGNRDEDGLLANPDIRFDLVDKQPPAIIHTYPLDGATGLDPNVTIWVAFSEPIIQDALVYSVELRELSNAAGPKKMPADILWHPDNYSISLKPINPLVLETQYEVLVGTNIYDLAGNNLANEFRFSFKTKDFSISDPLDLSFTVIPQQLKVNIDHGDTQNFSVILLNNNTRNLSLNYKWFLNRDLLASGNNNTFYLLNTTGLSMGSSYNFRIQIGYASNIEEYTWTLLIKKETLRDDEDNDRNKARNPTFLNWILILGIAGAVLGILLIPVFFIIRRKRRERELEKNVNKLLTEKNGEDWISDDSEKEGEESNNVISGEKEILDHLDISVPNEDNEIDDDGWSENEDDFYPGNFFDE